MRIDLTAAQIERYKAKASIETDRDIYTISIDNQQVTINGDWSIERLERTIEKCVVKAIESYCTKENIEWEYDSTYSAWCD